MLISLVGPNKYAKQRELKKIFSGIPYTTIYGEDGLGQWYELVGQSDLFGVTPAIVAVRLLEDLSAADQRSLAEYLTSQQLVKAEQHVVVLVEGDKQLTASSLGSLLGEGRVMQFPQPTLAKVGLWLQIEAKELGVEIERQAVTAMVAKFGGDQFALKTELERWALLQPAIIKSTDVEGMVPLEIEVSNFDLANSLARKDLAKAVDHLARLRLQGVPDQLILGSLAWKLESLLLGSMQGESKRSSSWSRLELEWAMEGLFQLDYEVKQGLAEYETGLEMWLVEAIGGGRIR